VTEEKICKGCGQSKARSDFWRMAKAPDGLQFYCKVCHRERIKAIEARHAEINRAKWAAAGKRQTV